jgi:hypothetical protein
MRKAYSPSAPLYAIDGVIFILNQRDGVGFNVPRLQGSVRQVEQVLQLILTGE